MLSFACSMSSCFIFSHKLRSSTVKLRLLPSSLTLIFMCLSHIRYLSLCGQCLTCIARRLEAGKGPGRVLFDLFRYLLIYRTEPQASGRQALPRAPEKAFLIESIQHPGIKAFKLLVPVYVSSAELEFLATISLVLFIFYFSSSAFFLRCCMILYFSAMILLVISFCPSCR